MKTKITQAVIGGIVATIVMSLVTFMGPYMGLPKMNPAAMLSMMMNVPVFLGWIMHFMIGIIFALMYVFLLLPLLGKVKSRILKGVIFGMAAFVFAQIAMMVMGAMFGNMPSPEGSMALMMIGSIMGHIIYGIVVALFVKK
jgi:uncharacterized membrane protein YagU involved in acid resistance